jgi:hypothetical protein
VQLLFDPDSWQEEVVHETFVSEYTLLMEGLGLGYPAKG